MDADVMDVEIRTSWKCVAGTSLLSGILIVPLLVSGCVATSKTEGLVDTEHNRLKCAGYCDLVIQTVKVDAAGKITIQPTVEVEPLEPLEPLGDGDEE